MCHCPAAVVPGSHVSEEEALVSSEQRHENERHHLRTRTYDKRHDTGALIVAWDHSDIYDYDYMTI